MEGGTQLPHALNWLGLIKANGTRVTKERKGKGCNFPWQEKGPTQIKLPMLARLLEGYRDRGSAQLLFKGLSEGFRIPAPSPPAPTWDKNLPSVVGMEEVICKKTAKEMMAGRVPCPFTSAPMPNLHISPLGVVPKKMPGEFRLIHHLSYPEEASVNDWIPAHLCSVKYASLDHAVGVARRRGTDALMAKADIESTFRLLPMYPDDFCLLGFQFGGFSIMTRAFLWDARYLVFYLKSLVLLCTGLFQRELACQV